MDEHRKEPWKPGDEIHPNVDEDLTIEQSISHEIILSQFHASKALQKAAMLLGNTNYFDAKVKVVYGCTNVITETQNVLRELVMIKPPKEKE